MNNETFHRCWNSSHEQRQTFRKATQWMYAYNKTSAGDWRGVPRIFYSSSGVLTLDTVHRWLYSAIVVEERRRWSAQMQSVLIRGQLNCFCIQKLKKKFKYEVVETSLSLSIVGMQPSPWPASCLICSSATPWTSAPSSLRRRWNRPGGLKVDFLLNQDVKWHTKLFQRTFLAVIFCTRCCEAWCKYF